MASRSASFTVEFIKSFLFVFIVPGAPTAHAGNGYVSEEVSPQLSNQEASSPSKSSTEAFHTVSDEKSSVGTTGASAGTHSGRGSNDGAGADASVHPDSAGRAHDAKSTKGRLSPI